MKSACRSAGACERECAGGGVNACTRWADELYATDAGAAEALWLDACGRRDGAACARLMQVATRDLRLADAYGWRACVYGDATACSYLGVGLAVRARAPAAPKRDSTLKLCLSRHGRIANLEFLRDSGSARWDRRVFEAARAWRYRPFLVDGRPVPICTSVTFTNGPRRRRVSLKP